MASTYVVDSAQLTTKGRAGDAAEQAKRPGMKMSRGKGPEAG